MRSPSLGASFFSLFQDGMKPGELKLLSTSIQGGGIVPQAVATVTNGLESLGTHGRW